MQSPIIELTEVSKSFDGELILPPLNLDIYRGDFLAVTGPNGGGKTTLLRVMLKLVQPTTGRVRYHGHPSLGYVPQKSTIDPHFPITVEEAVAMGTLRRGLFGSESKKEQMNRILEDFGLTHLRENPIGSLSGGQLQRVLIARAFVSDPEVLVLDEPLSFLDREYTHKLIDKLGEERGGRTVIVVSHDMRGLSDLATRHLIVDRDVCELCTRHHPHPL